MMHTLQKYTNPNRIGHKKQLIFMNSSKTNRFHICYMIQGTKIKNFSNKTSE